MSKVEAIKAIDIPTKVRNVQMFVGLMKYYRYMWHKCTHILAPLKKLCSMKVKFKCTDIEHNALIALKVIVGCDALLSCPNFRERFIIHTDASKTQLGVVINKNGKPIGL